MAAEYTSRSFKTKMAEMFEYSDVIFCNKDEALDVSRAMSDELDLAPAKEENEIEDLYSELNKIARAFVQYKKINQSRSRIAVITNSANPVVVCYRDINGEISSIYVPVPAIPPENLKDSNAAGDSFVGGFLAKLCLILDSK